MREESIDATPEGTAEVSLNAWAGVRFRWERYPDRFLEFQFSREEAFPIVSSRRVRVEYEAACVH